MIPHDRYPINMHTITTKKSFITMGEMVYQQFRTQNNSRIHFVRVQNKFRTLYFQLNHNIYCSKFVQISIFKFY